MGISINYKKIVDFAKNKRKTRKQKNSFLKILFVSVAVLILFLSLLFFFDFLKSTKGRLNFVVISNNLMVISYDPETKSLVMLPIPKNLYFNLAYGKGEVSSNSLFKFDKNLKFKGKLVTATIREYFGIPIDGWIINNSDETIADITTFEKNINGNLSFLNLQTLIGDILGKRSNFSVGVLRRLLLDLTSLRRDRIEIIDIENSGITSNLKLADDSEVLNSDTQKIDSVLNTKFSETIILKERLSIAVYNGTSIAGVAAKAARIINNIGGNVVSISDSDDKFITCNILVDKKNRNSYTVKRIQKIFNCDVTETQTDNNRAEIIVSLGKDYESQSSSINF